MVEAAAAAAAVVVVAGVEDARGLLCEADDLMWALVGKCEG